MTRKLISFRLPGDLVGRVDTQAGVLGQTRTMFVVRALEKALSEAKGSIATEQDGSGPVASQEAVRPSAPSRASKVEEAPGKSSSLGPSEPSLGELRAKGVLRPAAHVGPRRPRSGPIEKGR